MHIGFIGTGEITSAIVTGLCRLEAPMGPITVSPRNREKAARLAHDFADVTVAGSNQAVIDRSELVVLAVLPQDREAILAPLAFREDQTIINLLAGTSNGSLAALVAPADHIVRAVPLPCVARHVGPIALFPPDETGEALFGRLGTVIAVEREAQLEVLAIITALMAPYYALLETVVDWSGDHGVTPKAAADYTAAMFAALSVMAGEVDDGRLAGLVKASMTPGGLNEAAMGSLDAHGGLAPWRLALEAVKDKIGGA